MDQIWPILPQKEIVFGKWLTLHLSIYCAASCCKTSKRSWESKSWDTWLYNFVQIGLKLPLPWRRIFLVDWLTLLWSYYFTPSYYISKFLERWIMRYNCLEHKVAYFLAQIRPKMHNCANLSFCHWNTRINSIQLWPVLTVILIT